MSAMGGAAPRRRHDPAWRATALTGTTLLGALVLALSARGDAPRTLAVALAVGALPAIAVVLGPGAVRALRGADPRAVGLVVPVGMVLALLVVTRVERQREVAWLAIALLAAVCGLILVGADLHQRAQRAGRRAERSPWQQMTTNERMRAFPWRGVAGALLVSWAALLVLGIFGPHIRDAGAESIALIVLPGTMGLALVGLPVLVGAAARGDSDRIARAREDERQRVAAHLHDSVLQTLSLIQRQAADPAAVVRLARHQERALRAWMAGRPEQRDDTLAGTLQHVVEEVEREEAVDVEVTVLGDRALDGSGEALAAAAREALRNAARHAPGAAIVVFAELDEGGAAVYVRDDGPGFDPDAVAPERRGVRDAIVGRMAGAGGSAAVESRPGAGTEVALLLRTATEPPR